MTQLTKAMRAELLKKVIEDQFKKEAQGLDKEFIEAVKMKFGNKFKELDEEMHQLRTKHGLGAPFCNRDRTAAFVRSLDDIYDDSGTKIFIHTFGVKGYHSTMWMQFTRRVQPGIYVPPTFAYDSPTFEFKDFQGLQTIAQKQIDFIKKVTQTNNDLAAILNSVRSIKKLKELTSVFNPFLPEVAPSTAMLPVEQLLRVNELKSPKHQSSVKGHKGSK